MNAGEKIKYVEKKYTKTGLTPVQVGDTLKMKIKVIEADKVRIHPFEGTVIRKKGTGLAASFTVRKISFGEGVERIFPVNSPMIESIKVVSKGRIRHAKLYYLRDRVGKKAKLKRREEKKS